MCNHHFSPFQKGIAYCAYCNTFLPIQKKQNQKRTTKKLESSPRYYYFKENEYYSLISYSKTNYLTIRKLCIGNIRNIITSFNYPISVIYKAIIYLDSICLKIKLNYQDILNISTICVLLALQFNECCTKMSLSDIHRLVKSIPKFHELEIFCLQTLDYNLSSLSVYDYITNLFYNKLSNTKSIKKKNIISNDYLNCLQLMNLFIEDDRALDFPPNATAISIIKIIFEKKSYFSMTHIHSSYNINWKMQMYLNCNYILNTLFYNAYFVTRNN